MIVTYRPVGTLKPFARITVTVVHRRAHIRVSHVPWVYHPGDVTAARALRIERRSPRSCTASHDTSDSALPTRLKRDKEASGLLTESTAEVPSGHATQKEES